MRLKADNLGRLGEPVRTLGDDAASRQVEWHNAARQALYQSFGFRPHDRLLMFLPLA